MKRLARTYGLNYDGKEKNSEEHRRNILSGSVSGHNLEIYDVIYVHNYHARMYFTHRYTVLKIDENIYNKDGEFTKRYTSVKRLSEILSQLKEGKLDTSKLEIKTPSSKAPPFLFFLLLLILIFAAFLIEF